MGVVLIPKIFSLRFPDYFEQFCEFPVSIEPIRLSGAIIVAPDFDQGEVFSSRIGNFISAHP